MKKKNQSYKEIVMYIIFGIMTTIVSWGTYAFFTKLLPVENANLVVFVSNVISWISSVAFAFVTNKIWVFRSRSWSVKTVVSEGVAFVSARMLTGILEVVGVPILCNAGFDQYFYAIAKKTAVGGSFFYVDGIYSKMAFAIIVVILNYVFSKLFVFKDSQHSQKI